MNGPFESLQVHVTYQNITKFQICPISKLPTLAEEELDQFYMAFLGGFHEGSGAAKFNVSSDLDEKLGNF